MKIHRDKRGKFRCGETVNYKMTNHFGKFNREHEEAFKEAALEKYDYASGCPKGFRSKGYQTISGQRREVCCSSDGKTCMTADGIQL